MGKPRTPRDHDSAIAALRREALRREKHAEDLGREPEIRSRLMLEVASLHYAAEYLADIFGKVERAAR